MFKKKFLVIAVSVITLITLLIIAVPVAVLP